MYPEIYSSAEENTMWKYKEFMPVDETRIISLQEGGTPFIKCDRLGEELGVTSM